MCLTKTRINLRIRTVRSIFAGCFQDKQGYKVPLDRQRWINPPRDKTNKMACAPSEDSGQPGRPHSLIGLCCAFNGYQRTQAFFMRTAKTGQTGRIPRLIWVFGGRTCHFVGFIVRWLINIQSNLVISNSLISNYRLSRSENLVPVLTWNYDNR